MEGEKVRSDYMDANRDKINEQAGIDKVGGLIVCEECKSTKTTHYQKQTRVRCIIGLPGQPLQFQ